MAKSGNPKGAPKKAWTWATLLNEAVEEANQTGEAVKKIVARSLIREALRGNVQAIKTIMERMDGLPQQDVRHEGSINISFHSSLKQRTKQEQQDDEHNK